MPKSMYWQTDLLELIFNNTNAPLIGDATGLQGAGTAGSLYISLHTASPGASGSQTTSEANYTSYARVAVARTAGAWAVLASAVTNIAAISFPTCTGGSNTITHFAIGVAPSASGQVLYHGSFGSSLAVSNNIQPQIGAGLLTVTEL
jgi:hypothetical protein